MKRLHPWHFDMVSGFLVILFVSVLTGFGMAAISYLFPQNRFPD